MGWDVCDSSLAYRVSLHIGGSGDPDAFLPGGGHSPVARVIARRDHLDRLEEVREGLDPPYVLVQEGPGVVEARVADVAVAIGFSFLAM